MFYVTKSYFILVLICLIVGSYGMQNSSEILKQVETLQEYNNNENKSFYHYVPEFLNKQNRDNGNVFRKTPRILADNPIGSPRKNKNQVLDELTNSLATLQYQPVVVLMDNTCQALINAEYFTNNLLNNVNIRNEFWVMKFNSSGVTSVLAQSRINAEEFKNYIKNEIINRRDTKQTTGGSATFFAILKAAQILPKNSAILLFTEKGPIDEDLSQLALNNLIQKQIRLYVIWKDEPTVQGQEKLLKEAAIYSNGTFYLGNYFNMTSCKNTVQSFPYKMIGAKEEILIKNRVRNGEKLRFPVDYTVKTIGIIIEGNINSAILTLPSGYSANLLDLMSVQRLSPGGTSTHAFRNWAHVRFNTAKVTTGPTFGTWELKINGMDIESAGYDLTVYAETELTVSTDIVNNEREDTSGNPYGTEIKLNISGKISRIENISFVGSNGLKIHNLPYNSVQSMKIQDDQNTNNFKLKISNITLPTESFYVKVTGSTEQGEVFSRLSYVEQNRQTMRNLPMIIIESSVRSNLIATAGSNPKVIFEVTNNYDTPIFVPFSVQDEKRMLRDMVPRSTVIPPKGSVEITVYTIVPSSSTLQYTDLITLTAYGQVRSQKSAMLYVNAVAKNIDTRLPYLNYKFTSSCMEVPVSSCHSGIWSVEVTAQDAESGLLRVVSEPAGLYSLNGYVSGTKETVTLHYSSDCCQPYLDITAIDLNNNKYTYKLDAYHATLSTGSIIAITLGVLLLIIIIIIAVILIRKCCKERDIFVLPRYRGHVGTSRF